MLAVCSGKGGVGKSTLTANLAVGAVAQGQRVGILDADIYGHSIPHLLGIHQRPVVVDKMIVPPVKDDLKLMSIGFFLDDNQPVMWRGPMLHRALEQFLSDVHWGELDVLVVDMPPGTGDVAISLGQLLPRAEVIVVTTPQPAAQEVAARAALMAQKTSMRLLGVVENMSGDVFGIGGGERLALELGCRCSGRCRSTRGCARRATPASRSLSPEIGGDRGERDRRGAARRIVKPLTSSRRRVVTVRAAARARLRRRATRGRSPTISRRRGARQGRTRLLARRLARDARLDRPGGAAEARAATSPASSAGTGTARSAI